MFDINKFKAQVGVLLVCLPLSVFADDSITNDVTGAVKDTGKAIQKAGDKVGKAASDAGDYVEDSVLTAQVKAKLAAASDIPFDISVTTTKGVVALDGKVDTSLQASKAVELASSVHGVKDVNDSKLKVTTSDSYFGDAMITAKAKGRLMQLAADDKINSKYDLSVETTNGVVHVFGTVANKADEGTIKDSIKKMSDVKSVKTNITVSKP